MSQINLDEAVVKISRMHGLELMRMRRTAARNPWRGREDIPQTQRLVAPSYVDPDVGISLLVTLDQGYHASGWWRNSEYDQCWHASLVCMDATTNPPSFTDPIVNVTRAWTQVLFGAQMRHAWIEPPASPLDVYRNARASQYTTHVRIFIDRKTRLPITPKGEVYDLVPWAEGDSPEKIFRS